MKHSLNETVQPQPPNKLNPHNSLAESVIEQAPAHMCCQKLHKCTCPITLLLHLLLLRSSFALLPVLRCPTSGLAVSHFSKTKTSPLTSIFKVVFTVILSMGLLVALCDMTFDGRILRNNNIQVCCDPELTLPYLIGPGTAEVTCSSRGMR